jgi:2,3-bisphosphoglycerate-independent phosphoglycerate mutase
MGQKNEDDILVASKKVESYAKAPEMSAEEITEKLLAGIKKGHNFVVANFANGDMVGHTGDNNAAVKACEEVDKCLGEVLKNASDEGYKVMITADHGNCENMIEEGTGKPNKEHTANPVPFVYLDFTKKPYAFTETNLAKEEYIQYCVGTPIGVLADIAPCILANLGVDKPEDMSGMDLTAAML